MNRDKIVKLLDENDERLYHGKVTSKELADRILALLDNQRCEWVSKNGGYETSCGSWLFAEQADHPNCPDCGKKINIIEPEEETDCPIHGKCGGYGGECPRC